MTFGWQLNRIRIRAGRMSFFMWDVLFSDSLKLGIIQARTRNSHENFVLLIKKRSDMGILARVVTILVYEIYSHTVYGPGSMGLSLLRIQIQ